MVELVASDVLTKEVLDWQGLHLFHFSGSSCSQKLRIYMRLKNIPVTLRPTNLLTHENETDWYMGINPRGLVPTLIDDGKVIIESNDIITHLENKFPTPSLIPEGRQNEVEEMLKFEDDLHMDFRTLTLRFFVPSAIVQRSDEQLTHYTEAGSGQVQGEVDTHKADETAFWQDMKDHRGVPEFRTKAAVTAMREAFENYETQLAKHAYLLGDALSVLDIAWYVYANRLVNIGYPLATLHPHVAAWFADIHKRPDFYKEVATPLPLRVISRGLQTVHRLKSKHIGAYLR